MLVSCHQDRKGEGFPSTALVVVDLSSNHVDQLPLVLGKVRAGWGLQPIRSPPRGSLGDKILHSYQPTPRV